jgi:hypothetical protein
MGNWLAGERVGVFSSINWLMSASSPVLRLHAKPAEIAGKLTISFMRAVLAPHPISRTTPKKEHNQPLKITRF